MTTLGSAGASALGNAIPSNQVNTVAQQLLKGGSPTPSGKAFLGVSLTDATGGGAQVQSVVAGGPAATAGIQSGWTILAIGGHSVTNAAAVAPILAIYAPGQRVAVTVRLPNGSRKVIVGQDRLLERVLVALLSGGHILVEGVPGLAKTATVRAFASAIGGKFGRIQFTPDLVPSDLVGTRVFNPRKADFSTELGPIFCNLLLADEVNRAPAKVQSALLEVMQERQVTIGKETFKVDEPFLVLATQNPIEADGTYPLPEAQIDRFMLKVVVGYPSSQEEMGIVGRMIGEPIQIRQVLIPEELVELQRQVRKVYVDPAVIAYATTLVSATRNLKAAGVPELESAVDYGGSPRATIHLVSAGRALAFIRGRSYVLGQDLAAVAPEVLRHRIVLSYEGIADGVSPDTIVRRVLETTDMPRLDLGDGRVV
ncbi:MAG: PDZ domain-containing protein [Chloroflexi bacterium]|nr:MAG: PDZ domain-containing protein [Chloroflexota bacterium]